MRKQRAVVNYRGDVLGQVMVTEFGDFGYHQNLDGKGYRVVHIHTMGVLRGYDKMRDARRVTLALSDRFKVPQTKAHEIPITTLEAIRYTLDELGDRW